jgi:hypothetical protein
VSIAIFGVIFITFIFIIIFITFVFIFMILTITPNVMVEWLTFLLRIREVLGSNLGPETGYPERFVVFLYPSRRTPG